MNTTKIKIVGLLWLTSAWISTTQAQDNFQIMLSGAYQALPNHSAGSGGGNAVAMGTVLCYDIFVNGVNPTGAAIFGPAPAGSNGPFIADLTNAMSNLGYPNTIEYSECIGLTDEQLDQLYAGLLYVNIASSNYPLGELRGQICPLTDDGDCDGDGVPNIRDGCALTPSGSVVNGMGCTIYDLVPCDGWWKDHDEYVVAFTKMANNFWTAGLITTAERNHLVKEAENSTCGTSSDPLKLPCDGPWASHHDYVKAFRKVAIRAAREGRITVAERNALIKQAEESSCGPAQPAAPPPPSDTDFTATLRGLYEVPPNKSLLVADGHFSLDGNFLYSEIDFVLPDSWPTSVAIYGPASPGENGPLILELTNYIFFIHPPGPPLLPDYLEYWSYDELTTEQIQAIRSGLFYASIATIGYPGGDVRGQVCPLTSSADCDYDGVPNGQDVCPASQPGSVVDSTGCSIAELIPCNGPWIDHKAYVKSFREVAMRFWKEGRLTVTERNRLIKQAEDSSCGTPTP